MENSPNPRTQCRALNVSDGTQCTEIATSSNWLFCSFHAKQCHGLYRGYKLRNAKLDRLDANPPKYLKDSKIALSNQTFEDLDNPETCKEVHAHLFLKYQLLDRVIRARKLHHSRFFSLDMDYGHAKFLDSLQGQKATTLKALERLERRTAQVMFQKKKWFKWVRECQDEEEQTREKEQKKVKLEAAMFRRHWKATEMRLRDMKQKEQKLRSEAYLEQVYKERLAEREANGGQQEDDDNEMDWDPIEDVLEDNRASYVDLIESFLWMLSLEEEAAKIDTMTESQNPPPVSKPEPTDLMEILETDPKPPIVPAKVGASHSSKKAKAKSKPKPKKNAPEKVEELEPDMSLIETQQEMYDRLKNGADFSTNKIKGMMVAGTLENPVISTKTVTFPEEDIQRILAEVSEIKHLLFCRLLLSHAALLPAALRANSVKEFLADPEVSGAALRDLCLKMDNPSLQDIRDACADLFRTEDEDDDNETETVGGSDDLSGENTTEVVEEDDMMLFKLKKRKGELPDQWLPKRERNKQIAEELGAMPTLDSMLESGEGAPAIDFGNIKHTTPKEKIRVKICGRSIWNYPSNKAMSRGGWLHFCIIAKDSTLHEAVGLCRHWDEFFELNILAVWQYFPGANWAEWVGNRYRQQMLSLGFILYYETAEPDAMALQATNHNNNRRTRRAFGAFEARNFMCAHIKRDDPASRRLIQYLAMQSHRLLVLVRDAQTGKLVIKPPEEQRWLFREKGATGRAAREWKIIRAIGPQFFDEMEKHRNWRFSFKEYYDVYVWDLVPGEPFPALYNCVQEMLFKALRIQTGADIYRPAAPVLKTLCRNTDTDRVRDIKPGEQIESIYDMVTDSRTRFYYGPLTQEGFDENQNQFPRRLFYGEADRREDEILFPEEKLTGNVEVGSMAPLTKWEEGGLSFRKFVEGWESDYSDLDEDEVWTDEDDEESGSDEDTDDAMDVDDEYGSSEAQNTSVSTKPSSEILVGALQKLNLDEDLKDAMIKLARKEKPKPRDPVDPEVMREDFMTFLDKEKSRIFKKVWHMADLEPSSQEHYAEMMQMSKQSRIFNHRKATRSILTLRLIDILDVDPSDSKDLHKAVAKISPFFHPEFFTWKDGKPFKNSLLFKQEERSKILPTIRKHTSNKMRPAEFFGELDEAMKDMSDDDDLGALPEEWDIAVRPIIARLYKAGVIRTREDVYHEGQAFAAKEPGSDDYDLFIDWRHNINTIRMPPEVKNPYLVEPFVGTARNFAQKHLKAKFSVLRLWSAPHFWPLMIGYENRDGTSFRDLIGRSWIWMFVPKDMPCSEWSIHHTARLRLVPFVKFFGDRIVLKRDKFLVMGTDEKDLEKYTAALTYAIQMRPWRLEIDLWKSFVNVDVKFLEGLNDEWLE